MKNNKIFISLVSWRDPFIVKTVEHAIKSARFPELLTFGCVFDGYEEDSWMLDDMPALPNVKLIRQNADSSSPFLCHARGEIMMSLYNDEDYYLQVDCHSKFRKDWDISLRAELDYAKDFFGEKTILTGLNSGFGHWDEEVFYTSNVSCVPTQRILDAFSPNPPVRGDTYIRDDYEMLQEKFFNAGMFFAGKDFVTSVSQPTMFGFEFEQPIMTLRTYTAGYNMISPCQIYVSNFDYNGNHESHDNFVRYSRSQDPKWKEVLDKIVDNNRIMYHDIVSNNIINDRNGLYDKKSIKDYVEFAGFDLTTLKMIREVDLKEFKFVKLDKPSHEKIVTDKSNEILNATLL